MYDEDDDEEFDGTIAPRHFELIDLLVVFCSLVKHLFESFYRAAESLEQLSAAHANYQVDQRDFADEVRAELESIPTTED